jgi:hypothetical protein
LGQRADHIGRAPKSERNLIAWLGDDITGINFRTRRLGGFDELGELKFHGPFLTRQNHGLFSAPIHVFGTVMDADVYLGWRPSAFLAPNLERPVGGVHFALARSRQCLS